MNGIEETTNFLTQLSEAVGPVGAVFIFLGIILITILSQSLYHHFKRKGFSATVRREIDRVLDKIEGAEEGEGVILDTMRNMAQAIFSINKKMKNTISDKDALSILKLTTNGMLFLNFMKSSMTFSYSLEKRPGDVIDLKEQFKLELKNKWTDYINDLNSFRTALKIGTFIDDNFSFLLLNDDIIKGDMGLIEKISVIAFNQHIKTSDKYERIKTIFFNFSQELTHSLELELEKIMNGGETNGS